MFLLESGEDQYRCGSGPEGGSGLCLTVLPPPLPPLQDDFEFDGQASFQDPRGPSESTTPMEGENMGGWWPEFSAPDTGVRPAGRLAGMHTFIRTSRIYAP